MLTVRNAGKKLNDKYILQGISFEQQPLEKIAIAGETGSGKSTLLKLIGGHEQIGEGQIQFAGNNILGPYDKLIPGHPGIAYLSQHFELRNNYYVWEVLDYGNKLSARQANNVYAVCRINHLLNRKTNELSGGERQRIALAKQLVTAPRLLLLDEPFSNLDTAHRAIIKQVIDDIGNELKTSCILIAHDPADTLSWANTIIVLQQGKMIQKGYPEEIYSMPVNPYCASLFGPFNLIDDDLLHLFEKKFGSGSIPESRILRPEKLTLTHDSQDGIEATIMHTKFFGAHYVTDVMVGQRNLITITQTGHYRYQDKVYVRLNEPKK